MRWVRTRRYVIVSHVLITNVISNYSTSFSYKPNQRDLHDVYIPFNASYTSIVLLLPSLPVKGIHVICTRHASSTWVSSHTTQPYTHSMFTYQNRLAGRHRRTCNPMLRGSSFTYDLCRSVHFRGMIFSEKILFALKPLPVPSFADTAKRSREELWLRSYIRRRSKGSKKTWTSDHPRGRIFGVCKWKVISFIIFPS